MKFDKLTLLEILRYDTIFGANLTDIDRMMIHQYIGQKKPFQKELIQRIEAINQKIIAQRWVSKPIRYREDNGNLRLEKYNAELEAWETIKN